MRADAHGAGASNPLFFDFAKVGAASKLSTALPLRGATLSGSFDPWVVSTS